MKNISQLLNESEDPIYDELINSLRKLTKGITDPESVNVPKAKVESELAKAGYSYKRSSSNGMTTFTDVWKNKAGDQINVNVSLFANGRAAMTIGPTK